MKIELSLLVLFAIHPILCEAQTAKPAQGLPFDTAREMTVMVMRIPGRFEQPISVGSGVWVGNNGYIATCSHVIGDWKGVLAIGLGREPFVSTGETKVTIGSVMNSFTVTVVANDHFTDVAILKADKKPSDIYLPPFVTGIKSDTPQLPLQAVGAALETNFPKPGQSMLLAGYLLSERILILQAGISTGLDFFRGQNTDDKHMPDRLRIMLSLVSNPGNSGGPVFNDQGKVIGLLEGNLNAPIRDENGNQLYYLRQKTDAAGNPMVDDSGKAVIERAPYNQNSGISLAVPAKFVMRLAQESKISLE